LNGIAPSPFASLRHRVAGLHPGAIIASPSFDEPLPDDYWMGNT